MTLPLCRPAFLRVLSDFGDAALQVFWQEERWRFFLSSDRDQPIGDLSTAQLPLNPCWVAVRQEHNGNALQDNDVLDM